MTMFKSILATTTSLLLAFAASLHCAAQGSLDDAIQDATTLQEIIVAAEQFAANNNEQGERESEVNHLMRWAWYLAGRLGPGEQMVNIPQYTINGIRARDRMLEQKPDDERNIE